MKIIIKIVCTISILCIPTTSLKPSPSPTIIVGAGVLAGVFSYNFPKATVISLLALPTLAGIAGAGYSLARSKRQANYKGGWWSPEEMKKASEYTKKIGVLCLAISAIPLAGLIGYIASPYSKG